MQIEARAAFNLKIRQITITLLNNVSMVAKLLGIQGFNVNRRKYSSMVAKQLGILRDNVLKEKW